MKLHTCIGQSLCLTPTFCEACAVERAKADHFDSSEEAKTKAASTYDSDPLRWKR